MLEELRTKLLHMSKLAKFAIVNSVLAVTDENPSVSQSVFSFYSPHNENSVLVAFL
jgi:hypothetical protein